jgi:hypothetical protein
MADDKRGRDKQAHDADRRQRERALREELARSGEEEPPVDPAELAAVEVELESLTFPATARTVVEAVGSRELAQDEGSPTVSDLLPATDLERFDSPSAVRLRIQRPTVARAMKRVLEAADERQETEVGESQLDAFRKTFEALEDIDADDEDEGIRVIADWLVDRIREDESVPGSRSVRREAAKFCRSNGYSIRNDEWLGV